VIEQLKPYAEYKASGLSWLGQVPAHWTVGHGIAAFREKQVKNLGLREKRVLSLSYGRIVVKPEGQRGLMPDSFETYQIVDPGDIIIRSTDLQNDKTSLRVGLVRDRGIITSAYICLKTTEAVMPEFGYQMLNTYDLSKVFYGMGSGLRQNLAWTDFKRMPVFLPAREEQAAIVRFLDHATHRLDKAIRAKRKTVALLNEQKQAIIHRAVTRGLDPDVPLKDSGIPWLGKIPEHWEVLRLKTLVKRIDQGVSPQAENCLADEMSWGVVKAGCANRGAFREQQHKRLPRHFDFDRSLAIRCGDVLVSRASGSPSLVGSVGRVDTLNFKLILSDKIFRPVFNGLVDADYMVMAMNGRYYRLQVEQAISGAEGLANNLPLSALKSFYFAIPPCDEQETIVARASTATRELVHSVARIEDELSLLREYRTRLIADVVTGKLDVREAAARLPDTAPDSADESDIADADETLDDLAEEAA